MPAIGQYEEATVYKVSEHDAVEVPLADLVGEGGSGLALDPTIVGRNYFDIQLRGSSLLVQARGYVGLIPLNERVALEVVPRVLLGGNLAHVLRVAGFATHTLEEAARVYDHELHTSPSLRDFFTSALIRGLGAIEVHGRMSDYYERTERTTAPRGRILMGARETQMAAAGGSVDVRSSWFERTADTPVNRCLKLAVWLLANEYAHAGALSSEQRRLVRRLNVLWTLFADATLDPRLEFLDDSIVAGVRPLPTTRAYYRTALEVALIVVSRSSIVLERHGVDVSLPSLIFDLSKVFERYMRAVLAERIGRRGLAVEDGKGQGRKPLFDSESSEEAAPATPDIIVRDHVRGCVPVVLEVKYKPADGAPSRDALNQVITYAASYRAPRAVVVQPWGKNSKHVGLMSLGTMESLEVFQYVMDLASPDLEAEEKAFARAIRGLARIAGAPLGLTTSTTSS